MSPERADDKATRTRFPRVSGDEPDCDIPAVRVLAFSPRERG